MGKLDLGQFRMSIAAWYKSCKFMRNIITKRIFRARKKHSRKGMSFSCWKSAFCELFEGWKLVELGGGCTFYCLINQCKIDNYLDSLLKLLPAYDPLDVYGRNVDMFRIDLSNLHDLLHLGDADLSGLAHRRVEIHRCLSALKKERNEDFWKIFETLIKNVISLSTL